MYFGAAKHDRSNALTLAQQGDAQNGAMTHAARQFPAIGEIVAFVGEQVVHVHRLLVEERAPRGPVPVDRPFLHTDRYRSVMRAEAQVVAILQKHDRIISIAKLAGTLDNGLENRPDIGRRGCDHAEDVAAAGLISQRLREIARLGLHLVEQPHILDGDHGLVGEGRDQFDLLVGEGLDRLACQEQHPDRLPQAKQGNAKEGPVSGRFLQLG